MKRRTGRIPKITPISVDKEFVARKRQPRRLSPVINLPSQKVILKVQAKRFQRSRRKGQRVANPNRGNRIPAVVDEAGEYSDAGEEPNSSGRDDEETDHERRKRRLDESWDVQREEMTSEVYASAPSQKEQQLQRAGTELAQLQMRVDNSWAKLPHSAGCRCTQPDELSRRDLLYYSITCTGSITVPTWKCPGCLVTSTARAIPCGCFPTTAEVPAAWLDTKLLDLYGQLGPVAGLSATGMYAWWVVGCLNLVHACKHKCGVFVACCDKRWTKTAYSCVQHLSRASTASPVPPLIVGSTLQRCICDRADLAELRFDWAWLSMRLATLSVVPCFLRSRCSPLTARTSFST